ncbi:Gfo/Idh/MocA family protein [Lacunimicrobium album]
MLRIGIVGAGGNCRLKHIPGFRSIPDVKIVGVCNRTLASSKQVAQEFGIPKVYDEWQQLVDDKEIDAIVIGTWPNMHSQITCAALRADKHVLCEARMASNLDEARLMLNLAYEHPDLITQVVPCPMGLVHHDFVSKIIAQGFLGELREVVVIGADDMFWDYSKEMHWRQDATKSGRNVLTLGMLQEVVNRHCPSTSRVFSQMKLFEPRRPSADKNQTLVDVTLPDSIQIVSQFENGARGLYHISGVNLFGPGQQVHFYGTEGTIKWELAPTERVSVGHIGQKELQLVELPEDEKGGWRVEEEFVQAVRGENEVKFTTFTAAIRYMEFTEAAWLSHEQNQPVSLPL